VPLPPDDIVDLVRLAVEAGDRVVRLQLTNGHAEIATRDVNAQHAISLIVSSEVHHPYPHKITRREQFGRALAGARRAGADDALLVTARDSSPRVPRGISSGGTTARCARRRRSSVCSRVWDGNASWS
jgi:hypothetical protein